MVIASVCWFCAIVLMLPTGLKAMSGQDEEVLELMKHEVLSLPSWQIPARSFTFSTMSPRRQLGQRLAFIVWLAPKRQRVYCRFTIAQASHGGVESQLSFKDGMLLPSEKVVEGRHQAPCSGRS